MTIVTILKNKLSLVLAIGVLILSGGSISLFAAAPNGGYTPGQTLDPDCAPGDVDCVVTISSGESSAWRFDDNLGTLAYYNDGFVNPAPVGLFGASINNNTGTLFLGLEDTGAVFEGYSENSTGLQLSGESSQDFDIILNAINGNIGIPSHPSVRDDSLGEIVYSLGLTQQTGNLGSPNDVVFSGTYTGNTAGSYRVAIESSGTTFQWSSPTGSRSGVNIVPNTPISLDHGVVVTFGSATYFFRESWESLIEEDISNAGIAPENFLYTSSDGKLLSAPLSLLGGGGSSVDLAVNGTPNTDQTLLNLIAGTDISITDNGFGGVTIAYTGSGGGGGGDSFFTFSGQTLKTTPDVEGSSTPGPGTGGILFLVGQNAGTGVAEPNYMQAGSIMMGKEAGYNATNALGSNFLGDYAGYQTTSAYSSNFFGTSAGSGATNAYDSNFFGKNAGYQAVNARYSTFIGENSGYQAAEAYGSNFIGQATGYAAVNADRAVFIGEWTGMAATNAAGSNFIGAQAGRNATNGYSSNFIGVGAGKDSPNAANAIFIGIAS